MAVLKNDDKIIRSLFDFIREKKIINKVYDNPENIEMFKNNKSHDNENLIKALIEDTEQGNNR